MAKARPSEFAQRAADLEAQVAAARNRIETARNEATDAAQAFTAAQTALNQAFFVLDAANREIERRQMALEGLQRQLAAIRQAESSTPAAIRAAAEAAFDELHFVPKGDRAYNGPGGFVEIFSYRVASSVPRESVDAIARWLQVAPYAERREFEDRLHAKARDEMQAANNAIIATLNANQAEAERQAIETRERAQAEREQREKREKAR